MTTGPNTWRPIRDVTLIGLLLVLIVAGGWIFLIENSLALPAMSNMDMARPMRAMQTPWSLADFGQVLMMWVIMMSAMMLPSAAPTIFSMASRSKFPDRKIGALVSAAVFGAGYVLVWSAFSVAAAILQWRLDSVGLLSDTMSIQNRYIAGMTAIGIGLYQFSSWKQKLLTRCRASGDSWPHGAAIGTGAVFSLGLDHGVSCVGYCWNLMLVLFIVGPMNLAWIALTSMWVLAERALPGGGRIAPVAGAGLVAWGAALLLIG